MIGVINYQTGNAQSVLFALHHLGADARLVGAPQECEGVDRYVLPGVGAADVTMASLAERGWVEHLEERVRGEGVPFLGVCVGLQVLFEHSDEGDVRGLGWIPGDVVEFARGPLRVPHMGWNAVRPVSPHPFVQGLPATGANVYFVNSYYALPAQPGDVAAVTEYGTEFAAIVARDNVMATQFHVEKSGPVGLALLGRFARLPAEQLRGPRQPVPTC